MFLKSIEIRGFKSFADKTELVLKDGITVIVGPNGSGKSNILDAVKWVLGEQSIKNLRGGKMQDVIFAGTEFRKPVGLAQVTLVLDNSDSQLPIEYTDVTIMRRLFRSGESEYYINNTRCRLRDIQELFMDTGIGKEGYSIIGQGKIEAVLSGRAEERRSLLEEAAGIVKFKTRKEEAEKRLSNTEQNLQRINDIFSTYEERLEPLEKESEKAKTFLEISEKLKAKEVTLILNNIDTIENKIHGLKAELSDNELKLKELYIERNMYKETLQALNAELEKFELENNEERKEYYNRKTESQRLLSEIDLLNERVENLQNSADKSLKNLNYIKEKAELANKQKLDEESKNKQLLEVQSNLAKDIKELESLIMEKEICIEKANNSLKQTKSYEIELVSEITQNENEITILKNDISMLESKLEELQASKEAYINSIKINHTTKEVLKNEIVELDKKINEYEGKIKEYKKQMSLENRKLASNENKFKEVSTKHSKAEANCNALINLEKQHEGYNRAVKTVMQHIDQGKIGENTENVCILGEVIQVDKKFEVAIEVTLGAAISNIITKDEVIAKQLISYLKNNNLGRATFLPLTIVKGKKISLPDKIKNLDGYVGIASELVSFNKKYTNAIEYTLGRTIIAKDMDSALNIAKKVDYSIKIVTLSGEIINPGGALTGGSLYNKGSNIIGRKREIQELKNILVSYDNEIKNINQDINENKRKIKELDDDCLNLRDKIHYENIEKTKIKGKISAIDNETEKLKRDLNITSNEIHMIREGLNSNFNDLSSKEQKVIEIKKLEKQNLSKIDELEKFLEREKSKINNANEEITSLRIKKAQIDENILSSSKELERFENEVKELEVQMSSIKNEINDSNNKILSSKHKIEEDASKIKSIASAILKLEEKFKESDIKRAKIKEDIKKYTDNIEKIAIIYDKNERAKNNIQISLARYETEKESMYTKLNEEMELTYAEALEIRLQDENMEQCKKDILLYKEEISKLGVVNLAAIEEYKELMQKYKFMSAQKEDLINAKEELLDVVKEMTNKMKTVFHENFNKLRKNFNETFRELFKGGSADLILEDGDELSANIEINVQPPGKKLQNINLMSGGEKGLAAIALLFAILKMKPTPFCILDEIEAALDDYNVARYVEFLKKFSNNTQFVIITHRKGSMEAGDVLYGVTMEEKGVSKIVSVDLSK
ncbi:chromosome segregation protein SMC [Clostridium sp.]|uniref:chromosome segregation protein SMC n=1 Tax=Clostridium sp. TaxID=1506 RepID=UPI0039F49E12